MYTTVLYKAYAKPRSETHDGWWVHILPFLAWLHTTNKQTKIIDGVVKAVAKLELIHESSTASPSNYTKYVLDVQ